MTQEIVIDRRFRGPPNSGNGGYSCGVLGDRFDGVATVTLRRPPPLDSPLQLVDDRGLLRLLDGDTLIGEAAPDTLEIEVPASPGMEVARTGSTGYVGFQAHPFPTCFVCGPEREPGDGLRIFPGPVGDGSLVSAPWSPDPSLDGGVGLVHRRHVWAALDCPSYFALPRAPLALLGRLTARIDRIPEVGEPLVVMGWHVGSEGRKHFAGSALADTGGEVVAHALATWVEIDRLPG
ncbi:MAG TPA: hypothetical protein VFP67_04300 [Acidimicrobiia bacterium]|nr:hypothetical protein [Acidimicrobiia bacterium]